jgi:pimeloyl-ACP methyl ester carboxylesterase
MPTHLVPIDGATLEVRDWGAGEPIVFVQTALGADELLPLASAPALEHGYRKILYHRRGYAGSSPASIPGSIPRDARDCRALLDALGIERAHILGFSYSGAVALQLAADAPGYVQSLILVEPPPTHIPSAPEFRDANDQLMKRRRDVGSRIALEEFLTRVTGSNFRDAIDQHIPGAAAQMEHDAPTFFDVDLPALLDWRFTAADASLITCPVLHIGATNSGPLFAEVRQLLLEWLPHVENVDIEGADHALVLTHTSAVTEVLSEFLRRHPARHLSA